MSEVFKIIKFSKMDSIIIESDTEALLKETILKYLKSPRHLMINFDLHPTPTDDTLENLNFLATMLKTKSYDVQLFGLDHSVALKLDEHKFRNLKVCDDLNDFLEKLDGIERELRLTSILKSYLDNTMTVIFEKSGIILKRGELSLEDAPKNFINKVNYFQIFEMEDAFFSFVIAGDEYVFSRILEETGERELAHVLNRIVDLIPDEFKSSLKVHDYLTHPYSEFPTEEIKIQNNKHRYFKECGVMRIPIKSDMGEFHLEIWVPKVFSTKVFSYLNP